MTSVSLRRAKRPLRLTDETVDGKRRSASWVRMNVAGALGIDRSLAALGMARPVLIVSGFWRSGTTWLQECLAESLGAKTVFEPLSPMEPKRRAALATAAFSTEDGLQAFVPGPDQDRAFWGSLRAAAHGRHGSRFSLSCRRGLCESFRTGIVVKDVRLHRNLQAAHQHFRVPIIHIRRHPCAVVASLRAANWHWSFERISLFDAQYQHEDPGLLRECDSDAVSRLAAFWALHEREAAAALRDQPWAHEMTYEAMVKAPRRQIGAACEALGLRIVRQAASERPSASIDPTAFAATDKRDLDTWRTRLAGPEIERIEQVVTRLYPAWRTLWAA